MLNYNSVIENEIKQESISVKEISPVIKINLRGKKREFLTNIGKNLNMILPSEANTSSTSDKLTAIWLSPDEWMIVSNELVSKDTNKYELQEMLFNSISKTTLGAVVDVFASVGKIILRFLPIFVRNSLFLPLKLIFITGEISFTKIPP